MPEVGWVGGSERFHLARGFAVEPEPGQLADGVEARSFAAATARRRREAIARWRCRSAEKHGSPMNRPRPIAEVSCRDLA